MKKLLALLLLLPSLSHATSMDTLTLTNPQTCATILATSPVNGTIRAGSDCVQGSNPCTSGGTGATARRENGVWNCGTTLQPGQVELENFAPIPDGTVLGNDSGGADSPSALTALPAGLDASDATTTATGTPAPRSGADRAADVLNVKDFGAVGDCVADDTDEIIAAIAAAPSTGAEIDFPEGCYKTSAVLTVDKIGITFRGAGSAGIANSGGVGVCYGEHKGATRILGTHTSGAMIRVKKDNFTIRGITLDGDSTRCAATLGTNYGIHVESDDTAGASTRRFVAEDVRITNQPSHGIVMLNDITMSVISSVEIDHLGGHGIFITGGSFTSRTNRTRPGQVDIYSTRVSANGGHSILVGVTGEVDINDVPYRIAIYNFETFYNATNASVRLGLYNAYLSGENIQISGSATDGRTDTPSIVDEHTTLRVRGKNISVRNHRFIDGNPYAAYVEVHPILGTRDVMFDQFHVSNNFQAAGYYNPAIFLEAGAQYTRVFEGEKPSSETSLVSSNSNGLFVQHQGWFGLGTVPTGVFTVAQNTSAPSWTTNGIGALFGAAAYTCTDCTGTIGTVYVHRFGTPVLAASSATTYTNAATLAIVAAPSAGTNVTITNAYGLDVTPKVIFRSGSTLTGGSQFLNVSSNFGTSINTGTSTGTISLGGGSSPIVANSTTWDIDSSGNASGFLTFATTSGAITAGGGFDATNDKLVNLANGSNPADGVNYQQLQDALSGQLVKQVADWSTTGNITLSGLGTQANGEWTGTLAGTERIVVPFQTTSADGGIYTPASGAWTRTTDADSGVEITRASIYIKQGALYEGSTFTQNATVTTIGTDAQSWVESSSRVTYGAGAGLDLTGSDFSVETGGVTNAMLANMNEARFKMRAAGAGTGVPIDGTAAEAKTALAIQTADISDLATIGASGSAADLVTGTVPSARGGAGTISGVLKANGAGVVSAAASGTDFSPPTTGTSILVGNGSGGFGLYAGSSACSNQFMTALSGAGAATCTTDTLASAQHANQGTASQLLHGNGAGNPSWGAVALGTEVSGTLQAAQEPAHTGEVTNSAGSLALTIAANAVTNAKAAQMAAHTFKGNNTGSLANALDLTQAQLTADLNLATTSLQGMMSVNDKIKSTGCNLAADVTSSGTSPFTILSCQIDGTQVAVGDTFLVHYDGVTAAAGSTTYSIAIGTANPGTTVTWTTAAIANATSAGGGGMDATCTVKSIGVSGTMTCAGFGRITATLGSSATATAQTINTTGNFFITARITMSASTFRATGAFIKKM